MQPAGHAAQRLVSRLPPLSSCWTSGGETLKSIARLAAPLSLSLILSTQRARAGEIMQIVKLSKLSSLSPSCLPFSTSLAIENRLFQSEVRLRRVPGDIGGLKPGKKITRT